MPLPRQVKLKIEYDGTKKRSSAAVTSDGSTENTGNFKVGDVVFFNGGTHYYTSYPDAKGYSAKPGKARITIANGKGKAHPWHLIHIDNSSNVYGWVDNGTFSAIGESKTSTTPAQTTGSMSVANTTYTVVKGDNLWDISRRFLGAGNRYMEIYNANVDLIEKTAREHGKQNSYKGETKGWWIWPGEVLTIPGQSETKAPDPPKAVITQPTTDARPELGEKIANAATAISYTDPASGESDSVSISLQNIEREWLGSLFPKRGADIGVKLNLINWDKQPDGDDIIEEFNCGTFILDDISFSGRPTECTMNGLSVPFDDDFKSLPRSNTWERTTILQVAKEIAGRAGVELVYEADNITIEEIEQSRETDSSFLSGLCQKYDLAMKVYNKKIVIFDIVRYEAKSPILTLREEELINWAYNTTVNGTYTGVEFSYTNPDTDDTTTVTLGKPGRMYSVNTQANNREEAERQAVAQLNQANRDIETLEVTIKANPKLIASSTINIFGLEKIDGKYFIDKITHSIGSGYQMRLSMHKVQTDAGDELKGNTGGGAEKKSGDYKVGDVVYFNGGTHYYTSYPDAKGYKARAGKAKITKMNGSGKAHPWHLIHVDSESNVYGWVDDGTFK